MFQNKTYIYPTQTDAPLCEREKLEIKAALRDLSNAVGSLVNAADRRELYDMAISCADSGLRDTHAISHALLSMRTAAVWMGACMRTAIQTSDGQDGMSM